MLETPLSAQVVARQTIEDQLALSLVDTLRNVSNVAPGYAQGGFSEEFTARGFNTAYMNCLDRYRFPASRVPAVLAEQVEVVK